MIKRRQEEKKHLQDTIKMLQTRDEVELQVGKTQYRLLLAQWERSHAQRELKNVVNELRSSRQENAEISKKIEEVTKKCEDETQALKQRISECLLENDGLRQECASNFTPEKAHQLANQIEEVSQRKTELEQEMIRLRQQKNHCQSQLDEAKLQARQAQEL